MAMKASKAKIGNFQVKVKREKIAIKTYPVGEPEKNSMFFEKRSHAHCSVRMKTKGDRNDRF